MHKPTVCPSGKKLYVTEYQAEEALLDAHARVDFRHQTGPIGIYKCEDCGHFHLTSQGTINERLQKFLKSPHLGRERTAQQWIDKLKHKHS